MFLKNYQRIAVEKLLTRSAELLIEAGSKKLIFKSPTGSGKTIMMADFLGKLVNTPKRSKPLSFIWTAPRQLHAQSRARLEQYFKDSNTLCFADFEDLINRKIDENQILFLNWESINKRDKNTIVRENEKEFYLEKIIENTKDDGRDIVLIIDESHHHATSDISSDLICDIAPKLTIEVSATPIIQNADEIVRIEIDDVKLEGMIKKSVLLNPNFKNAISRNSVSSSLSESSDSVVLAEAMSKRAELVEEYSRSKIRVNPLLLIQLPDKSTGQEDLIKEQLTKVLSEEYDITVKNGKLAIYLSEEKENLTNISRNTNEVEVLIFKQAIALGWDCPRAHILVLFRDWKSLSFSIQTVGRIMRMPEPDRGHYQSDILNHGYLYTNLSDIEINEDIAKRYLTVYTSRRIDAYKNINLVSVHRIRQREKTRLNPSFIDIFFDESETYGLVGKIATQNQSILLSFISDYQSSSVDQMIDSEILSSTKVSTDNEEDIQKLFNFYIRKSLTPLYPEDRSVGRVKEAIYHFFREKLGIEYFESFSHLVKIVLSEDNTIHFSNVISQALQKYLRNVESISPKLQITEGWEVPKELCYGSSHEEKVSRKSVVLPYYSDQLWKTEQSFIDFLDGSKQVIWWFKNGDRDATYFAVPYVENGKELPFYVDFIVQLMDGSIGLFDTKSGNTIKDAREKSDGLQKYIAKHRSLGLIGGIVTNTDQVNMDGRWIVYKGAGRDLEKTNFSNWSTLDLN